MRILVEDEQGNRGGAGKLILLHKVRQRNASHDHGKNMKKLRMAYSWVREDIEEKTHNGINSVCISFVSSTISWLTCCVENF